MANKKYARVVYLLSQYRLSMLRIDRSMSELCKWKKVAAIIGSEATNDIEEMIKEEAANAAELRFAAEALMNSVTDERARLILRMRFIDGKTVEQVADDLNIDARWIFRLQQRAMEEMLRHPFVGV